MWKVLASKKIEWSWTISSEKRLIKMACKIEGDKANYVCDCIFLPSTKEH